MLFASIALFCWYRIDASFTQEKVVEYDGIRFSVCLLEAKQLAKQEATVLQLTDKSILDSLAAKYSQATVIDFRIDLSNSKAYQAAGLNARSQQDFLDRKYILDYRIEKLIALTCSGKQIKPVLAQATIDDATNSIKIRANFPLTIEECSGLTFGFDDLFYTQEKIRFTF